MALQYVERTQRKVHEVLNNKESAECLNRIKEEIKLMLYNNQKMIELKIVFNVKINIILSIMTSKKIRRTKKVSINRSRRMGGASGASGASSSTGGSVHERLTLLVNTYIQKRTGKSGKFLASNLSDCKRYFNISIGEVDTSDFTIYNKNILINYIEDNMLTQTPESIATYIEKKHVEISRKKIMDIREQAGSSSDATKALQTFDEIRGLVSAPKPSIFANVMEAKRNLTQISEISGPSGLYGYQLMMGAVEEGEFPTTTTKWGEHPKISGALNSIGGMYMHQLVSAITKQNPLSTESFQMGSTMLDRLSQGYTGHIVRTWMLEKYQSPNVRTTEDRIYLLDEHGLVPVGAGRRNQLTPNMIAQITEYLKKNTGLNMGTPEDLEYLVAGNELFSGNKGQRMEDLEVSARSYTDKPPKGTGCHFFPFSTGETSQFTVRAGQELQEASDGTDPWRKAIALIVQSHVSSSCGRMDSERRNFVDGTLPTTVIKAYVAAAAFLTTQVFEDVVVTPLKAEIYDLNPRPKKKRKGSSAAAEDDDPKDESSLPSQVRGGHITDDFRLLLKSCIKRDSSKYTPDKFREDCIDALLRVTRQSEHKLPTKEEIDRQIQSAYAEDGLNEEEETVKSENSESNGSIVKSENSQSIGNSGGSGSIVTTASKMTYNELIKAGCKILLYSTPVSVILTLFYLNLNGFCQHTDYKSGGAQQGAQQESQQEYLEPERFANRQLETLEQILNRPQIANSFTGDEATMVSAASMRAVASNFLAKSAASVYDDCNMRNKKPLTLIEQAKFLKGYIVLDLRTKYYYECASLLNLGKRKIFFSPNAFKTALLNSSIFPNNRFLKLSTEMKNGVFNNYEISILDILGYFKHAKSELGKQCFIYVKKCYANLVSISHKAKLYIMWDGLISKLYRFPNAPFHTMSIYNIHHLESMFGILKAFIPEEEREFFFKQVTYNDSDVPELNEEAHNKLVLWCISKHFEKIKIRGGGGGGGKELIASVITPSFVGNSTFSEQNLQEISKYFGEVLLSDVDELFSLPDLTVTDPNSVVVEEEDSAYDARVRNAIAKSEEADHEYLI